MITLQPPSADGFDFVRERLGPKIVVKPSSRLLHHPGRYICHAEDEPLLITERFDHIGEAMQTAHDMVALRQNQNGCADAVVFDIYTDEIVAQFGLIDSYQRGQINMLAVGTVPIDTARRERIKCLVKAWDRDADSNPPPLPFIWQTLG